jgi:hypothetical protein
MDELLSTVQVGWILDRSPGTIRDQIKSGEIQGTRLATGFRIPRAEVLRIAREKVEAEAGRKLSDRALERLIDEVLSTNEAATS